MLSINRLQIEEGSHRRIIALPINRDYCICTRRIGGVGAKPPQT
jgi:hypothetical protein